MPQIQQRRHGAPTKLPGYGWDTDATAAPVDAAVTVTVIDQAHAL
jgi:hypothetical protein